GGARALRGIAVTRRAKRKLGIAIAVTGIAAIVAVAALVSCVVPLGDGPRRVAARDLTTEVIVPTYDEVVDRAAAMAAAAHAFADAPAQGTLDALQDAWRAAREPWKQTDAFRFGPLSLQSLGTAIDQLPIDPAAIDALIAGAMPIDRSIVASQGA